ncbi:MAG: hypothetical protein QOF48_972 [Verrucomicrobiota bacterium]|jgi:hypothetical protein
MNLQPGIDGIFPPAMPSCKRQTKIRWSGPFQSGDWRPFRTIIGDGTTVVIRDAVTSASQRFYRLRMDP